MPNFSHKFAMQCTEQQWNTQMKDGYDLSDKLKALGYDLSELRFYPNNPFVATFYKNKDGMIGTTSTPSKDGRQVIDEWNAELFFALSCQKVGKDVTPGEFFTNKDHDVLRCHEIAGNWLRHNKDNGKNNAYPINLTHKSTYEELVYHFTQKVVASPEIEEELEVKKRGRKPFLEKDVDSTVDKETVIEAAKEIVNAEPAKTFEEMKEVVEKKVYSKPELVRKIESVPIVILSDLKDPEVKLIKGSEDLLYGRTITPFNEIEFTFQHDPKTPASMTFPQLLQWFATNDKVVYGWAKGNEIHSEIKTIQHISKEGVKLEEDQNETGFEFIFQDQESFLNYALSIIKNKAA